MRPPGALCCTAFSSSASSASTISSRSSGRVPTPPGVSTTSASPMCAQRACTSASSASTSVRHGRDVTGRGGALEQEQALQQPRHARELAGDDAVRLLGLLARPGAAAPEHLQVALGDRDRRQHLVRDVGEEDLLPLERGGVLLGQRLGHAHRLLPPLRVEDHGEEHQRHQRHLGLLRPALAAGHDRDQRHAAGRDADEEDAEHRARAPPDAEAVEDREADVDEVERDGLPTRETSGSRSGGPSQPD